MVIFRQQKNFGPNVIYFVVGQPQDSNAIPADMPQDGDPPPLAGRYWIRRAGAIILQFAAA